MSYVIINTSSPGCLKIARFWLHQQNFKVCTTSFASWDVTLDFQQSPMYDPRVLHISTACYTVNLCEYIHTFP